MATLQEVQAAQAAEAAAVTALQTEQAAIGASITAEIQRVEAAILAAQGSGIPAAQLDPIVAALNTSVTNLTAVTTSLSAGQASLDAEQSIQVIQPPAPGAKVNAA